MDTPQFLMFIPLLKKLMVDTSAETIHHACNILDENSIRYRIQTLRMQGIIGTGLQSSAYLRSNISQKNWGSTQSTAYAVYVRRKDYEMARRLTGAIKLG